MNTIKTFDENNLYLNCSAYIIKKENNREHTCYIKENAVVTKLELLPEDKNCGDEFGSIEIDVVNLHTQEKISVRMDWSQWTAEQSPNNTTEGLPVITYKNRLYITLDEKIADKLFTMFNYL